jgi:uncharacterized protein YbjT (DUF2867 family)
MSATELKRVLVTGATGYVGGRLTPRLLEEGYTVRVLVRQSPDRLNGRPWADDVEVVVGDVLDPATLDPVLAGVDAAYYMIHSMSGSDEFRDRDIQAARNFGRAAAKAGVKRIIYLGGLGDPDAELSEHLRSRQETGDALREAGVPVTEFRAAIIIGSGSISFEMVRHLTERIPLMICPKWVYTRVQPIAIRNVLQYMIDALTTPASAGEIIEIGGAEVMTYAEMMQRYAEIRGLKRWLVPVPLLTPRLSSYWVHLVTPIPASIARPLIKGLHNEVIVTNDKARTIFPEIELFDYETAVELALGRISDGLVETVWSDALASSVGDLEPHLLVQEQGMLIERRVRAVDASPHAVYRAFATLGGETGWPPYNWLWTLRGIMDRMVGGIGLRRGRRHPDEVRAGEAIDFWRVEQVKPDELLILRAEMKVPGEAWLRFRAKPRSDGRTDLVQTAFFAPKGLFGLLYWYGVYPLHKVVFPGMINDIARRAEAMASADSSNDDPAAVALIES